MNSNNNNKFNEQTKKKTTTTHKLYIQIELTQVTSRKTRGKWPDYSLRNFEFSKRN